MSRVSNNSKALLAAGALMVLVGVPILVAGLPGAPSYQIWAPVGLAVPGFVSLIFSLESLRRDGVVSFPQVPKVSPVFALVWGLLGIAITLAISITFDLARQPVLMFYVFFVCMVLSCFAGLRHAGLRIHWSGSNARRG